MSMEALLTHIQFQKFIGLKSKDAEPIIAPDSYRRVVLRNYLIYYNIFSPSVVKYAAGEFTVKNI